MKKLDSRSGKGINPKIARNQLPGFEKTRGSRKCRFDGAANTRYSYHPAVLIAGVLSLFTIVLTNKTMTEAATTSDAPMFSAVEVEQFEADDVVAGSAIGKMLSVLFLYTVLAMSFVGWWTYTALQENHGAADQQAETVEH